MLIRVILWAQELPPSEKSRTEWKMQLIVINQNDVAFYTLIFSSQVMNFRELLLCTTMYKNGE